MDIITVAASSDVTAAKPDVAILPIGSFEQHGDHLPLSTDTLVACSISSAIAARYSGVLLLPPITIACSHEHAGWPGTVSISATTLHNMIMDIFSSLRSSGIERLAIVNGHGGNYVLSNVVQELTISGPCAALYPGRDDWSASRVAAGLSTDAHDDMHAGEIETSLLLHIDPQLVRPSYTTADHDGLDRRALLLTHGMKAYTKSGVIGQPSLATAEKGRLVLESLARSFAPYLGALRHSTS
ncbi:creatininase family protein [Hamadaea tsunoensis]|uniref:creatininase family protein n=1 Tax=Hamadaea tsunoensis TaxID=53368 RepID=UPI00040C0D49|nr:creatininase family protein [Hamadaea tsunoensis]